MSTGTYPMSTGTGASSTGTHKVSTDTELKRLLVVTEQSRVPVLMVWVPILVLEIEFRLDFLRYRTTS